MQIEVCQRLGDWWIDSDGKEQPKYHAQIKNAPGAWAAGKSPAAAIGDLVMSFPEQFNITITPIPGKQPR